jgi:hypothetical protein
VKHQELPRVLRRAVGLVRFARESVGASAASVFLLDRSGTSLSGLLSEWDWTRTSFPSDPMTWPSVAAALADGEPRAISASEATGAECGWFEARGITRSVCVPLGAGARSRGVLFFDFDGPEAALPPVHVTLLADVARRCMRAFTRDASSKRPLVETACTH